ncbi:MAG: hypothetical protein LBR08_02815 [Bacteroidales bacterium]|jgi:hypothetical protein|nr:hypothetical protein [Bacteroidales bacterium]
MAANRAYRLSNGDDRYDYFWKLVPDEAFADEFVHVYRLFRLTAENGKLPTL